MVGDERASNALFWNNAGGVEPTIVLFSGGRDSTLAAVRCILSGAYPVLCVFDTGFGLSRELIDVRINELRSSVGVGRFDVAHIPVYGLVRAISLRPLVEDIVRDRVNLIPLGESLAMHAAAVVAAQRMGAKQIVNGFTGYQRHLPEQGMNASKRLSQFIEEYGLNLNSPLLNVESVQEVQ